jgi:hypothetical protein
MTDDWDHPTMTRSAFEARHDELMTEDAEKASEYEARGEELPFFWLSFADPTRELGFLGGCFVQAATHVGAVEVARGKGLNPGGEVQMHGPYPAAEVKQTFRDEWCNRLLNRDEASNMPDPVG